MLLRHEYLEKREFHIFLSFLELSHSQYWKPAVQLTSDSIIAYIGVSLAMTKATIPLPPEGQDFAELMAVESIDENTFKSISKPCPGPPRIINGTLHISTYGGHIYAQSAWAAAQTVGDGFVIHVCILRHSFSQLSLCNFIGDSIHSVSMMGIIFIPS